MHKARLTGVNESAKIMKVKRDLKSPRRNRSSISSRASAHENATNGANMRVVVRVRPPNNRETVSSQQTVVKVIDEQLLIFDPKLEDEPFFYHGVQQVGRDLLKKVHKNLRFQFDHVFGEGSNNETVFRGSTHHLIDSLMNGYNCSVFVYGATGAGKTFTMLGYEDNPGITMLTMNELFSRKEQLSEEREFELALTYIEVYNETVQDLLKPGNVLQLWEDGKLGVLVSGIEVHTIENPEELFALLEKGNKNRTQHPTDANSESSRSHAVFQVYLRMKIKATGEMRRAKLSMIDLAGSERGAATGFTGARFAEGANINRSLLALGNCINSLADGKSHIPYRDSKLTRLLKDSLGGNCQTVMIANVSPSSLSYEDTYNTLKYATRAKKIKSNLTKNVVSTNVAALRYIKLNEDLKKEVDALKAQLAQLPKCNCQGSNSVDETLRNQVRDLYKEILQVEEDYHHVYSSKELTLIRKQLKEEARGRLSGLCADPVQKDAGKKRIGNVLGRMQKQKDSMDEEMRSLEEKRTALKDKVNALKESNKDAEKFIEEEEGRMSSVLNQLKADHFQKVCELQKGELRMQNQLLGRMSQVLQPCYLQLKGHGYASQDLTKSYDKLVQSLQGIRSVCWNDEESPTETELESSGESANATFKVPEKTQLNDTVLLETRPKPQNHIGVCAETLMARVTKPNNFKRVGTLSTLSNKENRTPFKRVRNTNILKMDKPKAINNKVQLVLTSKKSAK